MYLDPPAHGLVPSVDEKSQIQAPCSSQGRLLPAQTGLPMKESQAGARR
jgi:hypothetical protein